MESTQWRILGKTEQMLVQLYSPLIMRIVSIIDDGLLKAKSLLLEMSISEYLTIGNQILQKNRYQRKRVQGGTAMYSLLFKDLLRKCTMPPLVLAFDDSQIGHNLNINASEAELNRIIKADNLLILDGLQRTYTMLSICNDPTIEEAAKNEYLAHTIRVEVYVGLKRTGILYRMLTLNSGQTPMSKRHQIEILYSRYKEVNLRNIKFICQVDDNKKQGLDMYDFDDIIEGFNSYINGDESPIDKFEIREIVQRLEKITNDDYQKDIFEDFVLTYNSFAHHINELSHSWSFYSENQQAPWRPYGKDMTQFFSKSQTMSAFGAAIGSLIQDGHLHSLEDVSKMFGRIELGADDVNGTFFYLMSILEEIRTKAPKIGVEQRYYLRLLFSSLFGPDAKGYCNISAAIQTSFEQYQELRWKQDTIEQLTLF